MRSDGISTRNWANAQKSTGPRTPLGQAVVAQNARRHGVTAKPDPTSVALWMRIILDKPNLAPGDLLRNDGQTSSALALAEAEVKLCAARAALERFERADAPPSGAVHAMRVQAEYIARPLMKKDTPATLQRFGLSLLRRIAKDITPKTVHGGKRHKLLQRYVREAHGHRKRAFQAWLQYHCHREVTKVKVA
ncbi:hypothetical protein AB9F26_11440 [Falsihalocynthiibacter sp. BN13B15]|uniref:hypothetical protein n=1 Tax=Falsihalocynthiibacter sp. BN13B15 TaxID=3240871 RepID=UPI00350F7A56